MTTHLNFWGTTVEVDSCEADEEELRFFYGAFISSPVDDPDVSVSIRCLDWPSRGFFASSLAGDGLRKQIAIVDHRDAECSASSTFSDWSDIVSPFPPFATSTLASRLATSPGAVVRGPNGALTALLGDHYVGKTATALALCREHGAQLISDSVIVLDMGTSESLRYESPIGLRREALRLATPVLDRVHHRLTVSKDTGLVALVQPVDILGVNNARGGRLDHLVLVTSTEVPNVSRWTRHHTSGIGWYTKATASDVARALPAETLRFEASVNTSPPERARQIAQLLYGSNLD